MPLAIAMKGLIVGIAFVRTDDMRFQCQELIEKQGAAATGAYSEAYFVFKVHIDALSSIYPGQHCAGAACWISNTLTYTTQLIFGFKPLSPINHEIVD
jgi:hypothetical protein